MNKKINKAKAYLSYLLKLEKNLSKPIIWQIEPTNACMMDCIMCPRSSMTRKIGFMDIYLFKKIIDQLEWNDNLYLHHFGESLLHPKIIEMVKYVFDKGIKPAMSVNPKLLTKKMCEGLINAGLKVIIISLDAIDDEEYKKIRGKNANYNEAIENIRNLLETKKKLNSDLYISIQMVKLKENKCDSKIFKELWENEEGVNNVEIKNLITFDGSNEDIIKQGDEETLSNKFKEKKRKGCTWGWFSVAILWDGRVVSCCYDYDGKYILGDLNKESLKDIWNNDKIKRLRRQIKVNAYYENPLCRYCYDTRGVRQ